MQLEHILQTHGLLGTKSIKAREDYYIGGASLDDWGIDLGVTGTLSKKSDHFVLDVGRESTTDEARVYKYVALKGIKTLNVDWSINSKDGVSIASFRLEDSTGKIVSSIAILTTTSKNTNTLDVSDLDGVYKLSIVLIDRTTPYKRYISVNVYNVWGGV